MYLPKRFENENLEDAFALIQKNPLATIISSTEQGPFVSHVPLILEKQPDGLILIGHLARGNPHWKLLDDKSVYVIFHGPNAYMTPKWYEKDDVPTWSYAVVHINGSSSLIQNLDGIVTCLKKLSNAAEGNSKDPWEFWIPDDLAAPGVIERCVQGLLSQNNDTNKELAEMMIRSWKAYHD